MLSWFIAVMKEAAVVGVKILRLILPLIIGHGSRSQYNNIIYKYIYKIDINVYYIYIFTM